jgi:hypothetical protein
MSPPVCPSPAKPEPQPEVGDLIVWSSGDENSPPKQPAVHLHPDMISLCQSTPLDDLLGLCSPPKPAAFNAKSFVHSLFLIPCQTFKANAADNEDVIFAFQERLCSIIEVEIVKDSGQSQQIFPTKLNEYLNQTPKKPVDDNDLVDFLTPKATRPAAEPDDDGEWVRVSSAHVNPTPKRDSPETYPDAVTPKPIARHRERRGDDIPTPKFTPRKSLPDEQIRKSPKRDARSIFSAADDSLFEAPPPKSILKKSAAKTKPRAQAADEESTAPKYLITEPIVRGTSPEQRRVRPDEDIDGASPADVKVLHLMRPPPPPTKQRFEKADLAFNVSLRDLQLVMAAASQERQQTRQPVQVRPKTLASALVAADSSDDSD